MNATIYLNCDKEFFNMGNSMLYDSGIKPVTFCIRIGDNVFNIDIAVVGKVDVKYNGVTYSYASDMPDKLLDKFRNGDLGGVTLDKVNHWSILVYKNGKYECDLLLGFMPNHWTGEEDLKEYLISIAENIFNEEMANAQKDDWWKDCMN
jgi:hypothetical protein